MRTYPPDYLTMHFGLFSGLLFPSGIWCSDIQTAEPAKWPPSQPGNFVGARFGSGGDATHSASSPGSRYGWPGVLFEITEEHLRPFEIRPVIQLGWEVDSHSATHPDLTELSGKELEYQVAASRRYLRRKFGVPSDNFCYPSSEYDAATIASVKEAGYVGAVTENAGYASRGEPYELDRYEIEGGDGVERLAGDLSAGSP